MRFHDTTVVTRHLVTKITTLLLCFSYIAHVRPVSL